MKIRDCFSLALVRLVAGVFLLIGLIGPSPAAAQVTNNPVYLPFAQANCKMQLVDEFSDPNSGWPVTSDTNKQIEYLEGEYRILFKTEKQSMWVRKPGLQVENYSLQVDMRNVTGANGLYGLIFGISGDWSTLYSFVIQPTGEYSLDQFDNATTEKWTTLASGLSEAIHQGTAVNRLRIDWAGTLIKIYANDQLLATVDNATLTGARGIGFESDSTDAPNLDVRFDNFTLNTSVCIP